MNGLQLSLTARDPSALFYVIISYHYPNSILPFLVKFVKMKSYQNWEKNYQYNFILQESFTFKILFLGQVQPCTEGC
jgi:hypothetical protein